MFAPEEQVDVLQAVLVDAIEFLADHDATNATAKDLYVEINRSANRHSQRLYRLKRRVELRDDPLVLRKSIPSPDAHALFSEQERDSRNREIIMATVDVCAAVLQRPLSDRDRFVIDQRADLKLGVPQPPDWPPERVAQLKAASRAMVRFRQLFREELALRLEQASSAREREIYRELLERSAGDRLFHTLRNR